MKYLKEIIDVTDKIVRQISSISDEYERIAKADSIGDALCDSIGKSEFLSADVVPYYAMNNYYLVVYHVFRDVRLVFTPPSSLGKFGGDTDNWMWPHHTCDLSAFRVYANESNEPAEYAETNKPYSPKFVAEVSTHGYKEDEFAMTIGVHGSTSRSLYSWHEEQRLERR